LLRADKNGTREKSHQQDGSTWGRLKNEWEERVCLAELAQILSVRVPLKWPIKTPHWGLMNGIVDAGWQVDGSHAVSLTAIDCHGLFCWLWAVVAQR
jgi:hypothetical protein